MAGPLRQILQVTLRWGGAWAVIGFIAGILMMFNRSEFIAESGAKPHDLGFYADWIPLMIGAGFVFGLLLGLVFA